jgi:Ras-related protein Rab-4B
MFLETSALTGENVEETFLKCARQILTKIESGKYCMPGRKYPMLHAISLTLHLLNVLCQVKNIPADVVMFKV